MQLPQELDKLKELVLNMMNLVKTQLEDCREVVFKFDKEKIDEILAREKSINNFDNKIDSKSEDILALYNPVAVDLRFVMAALQINTFLERIGDNSEGIAKILRELSLPIDQKIIDELQLLRIFNLIEEMMDSAMNAVENESTKDAIEIFKKDTEVDDINLLSLNVIDGLIKKHPDKSKDYLNLLIVIRKMERTGDLITNIAEENIFYIDAKVLKHKKKKKKKLIAKDGNED